MTYFFQIYYDDVQKEQMFKFAIPYYNDTLTPFFENSVIVKIFEEHDFKDDDKVSICSWNLKNKQRSNIPPYRTMDEALINSDFDILLLTKNTQGHSMLEAAEMWHHGFKDIIKKIWEKIGRGNPFDPKYPVYQNAFVAKSFIYKKYIKEVLSPAMNKMEEDEEIKKLCWQNSNYYKLKNNPKFSQRVKEHLGVEYCPMHTFLCERFFSLWMNDQNFKIETI